MNTRTIIPVATAEYLPADASPPSAVRQLLEGRRIVAADAWAGALPGDAYVHPSGVLTLDDGTRVFVVENEGCGGCPNGIYQLERLAAVDNIITDVRLAVETFPNSAGKDDPPVTQRYQLFVVADAVEINVVSVAGDDGNGYYSSGYKLYVLAPAT